MNVINFLNSIARDITRPELAEEARRLADELGSLVVEAKPQPVASPQAIPFAEDHKGPRVNYHGLLARCARSTGGMNGELLCQMQEHLSDLGQRFYDGDLAVVDEFLQFYCIGGGARSAAKQEAQGGAA